MALNLRTVGAGLLGTHVTWAEIEEDMQRELDTVAVFGPNKTAKDIGDGNGFMSKIVLIDPDWQHEDKELPEQFIVKILSQLPIHKMSEDIVNKHNMDNPFVDEKIMIEFEEVQKRCHNAEVMVYNHLTKLPKGKVNIPKIYFMKRFTESNMVKGYIIMEYLSNLKRVHIYENVSPANLKQVLRNKAVIEAISLKFTDAEKEEFRMSPFKAIFGQMFRKEFLDAMMKMFRLFDNGSLADKIDSMEKIIADVADLDWAESLAEVFGMKRVLCHGDLWSMNILWREHRELEMVALVDYQTAHLGCAATDLVRLLSACLSGVQRRAHWEELLEVFYDYLKEEVAEGQMPYTLEQLKEAYQQYFPLGAFMVVPIIGPFFDIVFKSVDEKEREKGLEIVKEKVGCLLDDIFYYHERNEEIKRRNQKN